MIRMLKNLGHFFVALAAVIFYRFPARKLTVIGVTGTDGKTTTATLIYHILKTAGKRVALISTVAAYIGAEEIDTGFHVTSPNPWALQKLIRRIANKKLNYLVLEATSHGLDQHRLLGTNITLGVLTNITHEHLDYHRTYTNYLKAKAKLFRHARWAIVNVDDQSYSQITNYLPSNTTTISYSLAPFSKKSRSITAIKQRFPQDYNQSNALAAIMAVKQLDIDTQTINRAIATFPGVKGRLDEIKNNLGIKVVIDFAHTPNALKNILKALRQTNKGKLIAVYGAAGKRDVAKRPLMGNIGARLADEVILTAEDPRNEPINTIIHQMKAGITTNHGHVHEIPDRTQAINFAINLAQKGDIVGIFGKGHEQSMNLDGRREIPWSDHQVAQAALKQKLKH